MAKEEQPVPKGSVQPELRLVVCRCSKEGVPYPTWQSGKSVMTWPLCDLLPGFTNWKVMRVLPPLEIMIRVGLLFSLYSRSSAILSHGRSGESYLSKDQRETPLMCSTEINQTPLCVVKSGSLESSGVRPDPD